MQQNLEKHISAATRTAKNLGGKIFLDGALSRPKASPKHIAVQDPATEALLAKVPDTSASDVQTAVQSAHAALHHPSWQKMTPATREKILLDFADQIEKNAEAIACLLVLEQGKLLKDARGEVSAAVGCFRYFAGWATKIEGSTLQVSLTAPNTDFFAYTKRQPVGVVAAITPWNVPVMMFAWKVAPALACGCTVVLKPSEETPLTALFLANLSTKTGLPPGVLSVVTGYGHTTGDFLVKNHLINKVSFTGSGVTGKIIQKNAADHLARVTLELGGKNPVIVLEDADLKKVKTGVTRGVLYNQGQVCVAGSRLYLPKKHFDTMVADIATALSAVKISNGFDPKAEIGPLVSATHQKKVLDFVAAGHSEGLELATTRGILPPEKGYFVSPTLFANTQNRAVRVSQEEIFGPVLVAMPFDDIEDVIAQANNSLFGLSASIWTENLSAAHHLIDRIQAGVVFVNSPVRSDNNLPLGGFKQSGIGRELGHSAIEQYTELKSVCIAHT
jgi:phenylacetaldehyde dehydrogenase